jgi:hypothetical protein
MIGWPTAVVGFPLTTYTIVMAGLVPAIHGFLLSHERKHVLRGPPQAAGTSG